MKLLNREFSQRLLISVAVLLLAFFLIFHAFVNGVFYLISAVILLLALMAIKEYIQMTQAKVSMNKTVMIIGSCLVVVSFFIGSINSQLLFLPPLMLFVVALFLFITHFKKVEGAITNISVAFFGIVYVCIPLGMIHSILYQNLGLIYDGRFWLAYLISVTKITDIGAYLIGRVFGRRKLIVKVSPSKTLEGAIGGFVVCIGFSLLFYWIAPERITFYTSLILGVLFAVFAQVGDLSESLLKRDAEIKDSSSIPGIGGVLDMLDSIFINAPILYFFFLF